MNLPGVQLRLTLSWQEGRTWVGQCAWCGTMVAVPDTAPSLRPGPCPACGGTEWWEQPLPVGPFANVEPTYWERWAARRHDLEDDEWP